ncbi:MAG: (4Fe-4S)-binding protein [Bifidobacteriaceae bacterium]|jgi:uncharacterized Fe-S cluster protein YjdI/CDGSH-type Zn-finger protein|nr:(4Fe-4S)-binding protein [Bifidobacteriaceae bacterium]
MTAKLYWGTSINVTFDADLCLHAAECLRGAPAVFDIHRKPWVLPDRGDAFEVARVVERCPTGALKYSFVREYLPGETGETTAQVVAKSDGPVWLRGDFTLVTDDGATPQTRIALCRCASSANLPFCDGSGPCTEWRPSRPTPS